MPIYTKKSNGSWSTNVKKIFVKAADGLWKSATRLLAKTASGWVQMWPGDAPANNPNDPVNIRLNSYNGTVATSPQYINTVLYGHDNNGASVIGATPITITNRKMQVATDDTGQTDRYTVETVDIYDLTSNSETNVAEKRFYADGWWLFYQLEATNVWATTKIYSQPIKIIKQQPTFVTNSPVLSEDYSLTNPFLSLNFEFSDTWWKSADLSRSYVKWWQNTSPTPGGTSLKTTYIQDISGLFTNRSGNYEEYNGTGTTVSGTDSITIVGGIPASQYVIAEIVLINSYTDHYNSPVSVFKSTGTKPTVTALTVKDDNGNGVVDNQSSPRIISDGYLNFTATVTGALSSTYYLLEPRIYNWQNGLYYDWNSTTTISSTSFPTDLTPTSTSLSGTTATVTWRVYISADTLYGMGGPTYSGGSSRWQLEFRVSARASSSSTNASASYFNGIASLGGDSIYVGGIDIPGSVNIAPSSAMTLNVSTTSTQANSPITFSISTASYPSGYASYPRRYYIDYGDGTNSGWVNFSTGTSNPSVASISKTYTSNGTYTAVLTWEPQGDPTRSTRSRTITVNPALSAPTSVSIASVSRASASTVLVSLNHSGGSGPYYQMYWYSGSTVPTTDSYDAAGTGSPISDEFGISNNYTAYFYVRSSTQNLGNTTTGGNATAGTYSNYSSLSPNPSYTFVQPSGSVSVSPSSGTAGTTQFTATPSVSASPSAQVSYQWQFRETATNWPPAPGTNTNSTYTPPSNFTSIYGNNLRCQITANNGVGTELVTTSSVTVSAPATKLATPTNVSASDNLSTGIQVSWTNVANAATYGVWWGGVPSYDNNPDFGGPNQNGGKNITGSPFLDDGVSTGTTRNYYVQAFPSTGSTSFLKSDWSAGDSGTRVAPSNPPTGGSVSVSPSSGTAGATQFTASASGWSGSGTISYSFSWQYFTTSGFFWVQSATGSTFTPPANATSFAVAWKVVVTASNGISPNGTAETSFTVNAPAPPPSPPGTPGGVTVSGSGLVSWGTVSGATTYEVQNYTDRQSNPPNNNNRLGPFTTTGIEGTSFQLGSGQGYSGLNNYARAQVRARNAAGVSLYSAWFPTSTSYV